MMSMWVIYDHPLDLPAWWVARRFEMDEPTQESLLATSLEALRDQMREMNLTCIRRDPADEPQIVETWL